MRFPLGVVTSLSVGLVCGYAFYAGTAPSRLSAPAEPVRESGPPIKVERSFVSEPQGREEKTKRLLAAAGKRNSSLNDQNELYEAISAMDADDFRRVATTEGDLKQLFAKLAPKEAWRGEDGALALFARQWMKVDAASLLTWLPGGIGTFSNQASRTIFLAAVAAEKPEELLNIAQNQKDSSPRLELLTAALTELASKQPAKPQAWLAQCKDSKEREAAEKAIRLGEVMHDPMRAPALASALKDRDEARELIKKGAEQARDAGQLRQFCSLSLPDWLVPSVLPMLAQEDPAFAISIGAKVRGLEQNMELASGFKEAFGALAMTDPDLAKSKLSDLTGEMLSTAVNGLATGWMTRDPAAALDWLNTLPKEQRKDFTRSYGGSSDALDLNFSEWLDFDPLAARAWVDGLPQGDLRQRMQGPLANNLLRSGDPQAVAAMLPDMGDAVNPKLVQFLSMTWAQQDPQAAANWATTQVSPKLQNQALPLIVKSWGDQDPDAVAAWISEFPAGVLRDRCVGAFLDRSMNFSAGRDDEIAEFDAWFPTMGDPKARALAAVQNFHIRKEADPAAARDWLSGLSNVDPAIIGKALGKKSP